MKIAIAGTGHIGLSNDILLAQHNEVVARYISPEKVSLLNHKRSPIEDIVALDPRHKSHNVPGKFLTYMRSGLPVLANINSGNDLAQMIRDERVGEVCESNQLDELLLLTEKLLDQIETDSGLSARCAALFEREFAVEKTVKQIVAALSANEQKQ